MEKPLSALIAGNSVDEASTIAQVLQVDFILNFEWVDSMSAFVRALSGSKWDIIVCDTASFDIETSLDLARNADTDIFFVAGDDDAQAVLAVLETGAELLLKSRISDLSERVKRLPEKKLLPSEFSFFHELRRVAGQPGNALRVENDVFEVLTDHAGIEAFGATLARKSNAHAPSGSADRKADGKGRLDILIATVAEKTSGRSGADFLQALVEGLAHSLEAGRAFVGVPSEKNHVRILHRSNPADAFECQGSPCTDVLSGTECCLSPRDLYPECEWLADTENFCGLPLFDSANKPIGLLAVANEHSANVMNGLLPILRIFASRAAAELEFQHAKSLLKRGEEDFRLSFDLLSMGMAHISLDGKWLKANPALCGILGYNETELCNMRFHAVFHPEDLPRTLELQANLLVGKIPSFSIELRFRKSNGRALWVNLTVSILRDERNCPRHLVAVVADISQRRKAEEQIQFLANHDTLTKLPNRNFLFEKLGQRLVHAEYENQRIAILLLDLDRFKLVNDSLGHASGDMLMSLCGQYIAACLDGEDLAARLGSDEFAIVCSGAETNEAISAFSEKLLKAVSTPTRVDDMDISVTGCLGIAVYPDDGEDISTLLRKADAAMYRAKDAGGNHYRLYEEDMAVRTMDHLMLVNDLRHAIERDEFILHYQPQVDLATGEMTAIEALLRWNHPKRGVIPPADFIMLAEETGLIIPIGEWVLDTACRQAKIWQDMGMKHLRIAVNLSVKQFHKQNLAEKIADTLSESGLAPQHLELEITESAIMRNAEESVSTLRRLKAMGVRISIDDFGTGYSSLSYLKEFPIDKIKIDQSFVENIASNPDNAALANGIIALAHSIKLSVTAEGVENLRQLNLLSLSQCDSIQGFYFCTPLPAESLQKLIEQGKSLDIGKGKRQSRLH